MNSINRAALVITRKQPYVDWANGLEDGSEPIELEDLNDEPSVYLIPELETEDDADTVVGEVAEDIFTQELLGWCTDQTKFPPNRNVAMFKEWFNFWTSSIVLDVFDGDGVEHDA